MNPNFRESNLSKNIKSAAEIFKTLDVTNLYSQINSLDKNYLLKGIVKNNEGLSFIIKIFYSNEVSQFGSLRIMILQIGSQLPTDTTISQQNSAAEIIDFLDTYKIDIQQINWQINQKS